jgi:hypothetical protein
MVFYALRHFGICVSRHLDHIGRHLGALADTLTIDTGFHLKLSSRSPKQWDPAQGAAFPSFVLLKSFRPISGSSSGLARTPILYLMMVNRFFAH